MNIFTENFKNRLLMNDRLSDQDKSDLMRLEDFFSKKVSPVNHVLVASSGTSRHHMESLKLIALSRESILNSAKRFNQHYQATELDNWGLVLPEFHVAGLSVWSRAYLANSQVFKRDWLVDGISDWIFDKKISFISMVPAQIFDLVEKKIQCPKGLKSLFVGGGALPDKLRERILDLRWPLIETYGMTETASMIAYKEMFQYRCFEGVQIQISGEKTLSVQCDSLLTASMQIINGEVLFQDYRNSHTFETDDEIEFIDRNRFKFIGRKKDYIKILGEGVSLVELNNLLENVCTLHQINPRSCTLVALNSDRSGNKLVFVSDKSLNQDEIDLIFTKFNSACRPYEKIGEVFKIDVIPRTDLGKLKVVELKNIIENSKNQN